MELKLELPEDLYESMMYVTNGKTYVRAKDIEKYWRVYSQTPVIFARDLYIHISRLL